MMKRLVIAALTASLLACGGDPTVDGGTGGGGGTTGGGGGTTGGGGGTTGGGGGSTDTTPPQVISTNPTTGSMNVAVGTVIQVLFSEAMAVGTVTVTLSPSVALGSPTWNTDNTLVTLTPSAPLALNTSYTVTVNGLDMAANALSPVTFTFTTVASTDTTPPTVTGTVPSNAAVDIGSTTALTITFSESMNTSSVTITAAPAAAFGTATWTNNNTEVTVAPTAPYTASTPYTITVNGRDVAGNNMASAFTFTFTTAAPPDTTPPTLTSSTPASAAMNVTTTTRLSLTFSEPMETSTLTVTTNPAIDQGMPTWSNGNRTATFSAPTADWASATPYTVTVTGTDVAGNALGATSVTFTTAVPPDTTPPTVQSTTPAPGATGVPQTTKIQFVFSEPMDTTATQAAVSSSPNITCTFAWLAGDALLECTPSAQLAGSTAHTVTIGTGAKDKNNNNLAAPYILSFTTAAAPDTTPPTIASTTPTTTVGGTTIGVVRTNSTVAVTFSEAMNKAAAQAAFTISNVTTPAILLTGGAFSWNTAGTVMTYTLPAAVLPLAYGTVIRFGVSNTATDLAGNALATASTGDRNFRLRRQSVFNLYSCGTSSTCTAVVPSGIITGNAACTTATVSSPTTVASFGDNGANQVLRSYLNFDLTPISDARAYPNLFINLAVLTMWQDACGGNIHTTTFGTYERAYPVDYGTTLTSADCELMPLGGRSHLVLPLVNRTSGITKTADVTSSVREDFMNRATKGNRSQFQLRMSTPTTDGDATADYCRVVTHTGATSTQRPHLVTTFEYD